MARARGFPCGAAAEGVFSYNGFGRVLRTSRRVSTNALGAGPVQKRGGTSGTAHAGLSQSASSSSAAADGPVHTGAGAASEAVAEAVAA